MFKTELKAGLAALALVALVGCGETVGERGLSGAGIGAAGGALGGAMVGAPATGAIVGGAVGAGLGAFTDEDELDLGEPIWE